jgi:hypothetical protein
MILADRGDKNQAVGTVWFLSYPLLAILLQLDFYYSLLASPMLQSP